MGTNFDDDPSGINGFQSNYSPYSARNKQNPQVLNDPVGGAQPNPSMANPSMPGMLTGNPYMMPQQNPMNPVNPAQGGLPSQPNNYLTYLSKMAQQKAF